MVPKNPSSEQVSEYRIAFFSSLYGSIALCVAIHFIAPMFPQAGLVRLGLVILFFGCLASAAWSLTEPFANYITASNRWKYGEMSAAIRDTVDSYSWRMAQYLRGIGWFATVAVGIIALAVLSEWQQFSVVAGAERLFTRLGLLAVIGLPIYAVMTSKSLREAYAFKQRVDEAVGKSESPLRTRESEAQLQRENNSPPVEATGQMKFRAGGHVWCWEDFYMNAVVFGQPGSGKTLCILNALLDGLLVSSSSNPTPPSGLILDPKGDFRDKIENLCQQHGRLEDLIILDPFNPRGLEHWNPLDSEDLSTEVAERFSAVIEMLKPSGNEDQYWIQSTKRLMTSSIAIIRAVRPEQPPSLSELYDAAINDEELDKWGQQATPEQIDTNKELRRAIDYCMAEWRNLPENTRSSTRSFLGNMLSDFLIDPYDTFFSGRSSLTVAQMIDSGRILYVHTPIADQEMMAPVVNTLIKLEFNREILLRGEKPRPSFFFCDEFQTVFTAGQRKGDADTFERTRGSNHANIIAVQNLNSLLKNSPRREPVDNLLGNCATKIFLRNTDKATNQYASEVFGNYWERSATVTTNIGNKISGSDTSTTLSDSAEYAARMKEDDFTQLSIPARKDGIDYAEAMAYLGTDNRIISGKQRWKIHPIGK